MNLSQLVVQDYPSAIPGTDFIIALEGAVYRFAKWDIAKLGAPPDLNSQEWIDKRTAGEGDNLKDALKAISSDEALRRICLMIDPLDNEQISTRFGNTDSMRIDALVAHANGVDYKEFTPPDQSIVQAINDNIAEKNRLILVHRDDIVPDIESGVITTEVQVLNDPRWLP